MNRRELIKGLVATSVISTGTTIPSDNKSLQIELVPIKSWRDIKRGKLIYDTQYSILRRVTEDVQPPRIDMTFVKPQPNYKKITIKLESLHSKYNHCSWGFSSYINFENYPKILNTLFFVEIV